MTRKRQRKRIRQLYNEATKFYRRVQRLAGGDMAACLYALLACQNYLTPLIERWQALTGKKWAFPT